MSQEEHSSSFVSSAPETASINFVLCVSLSGSYSVEFIMIQNVTESDAP